MSWEDNQPNLFSMASQPPPDFVYRTEDYMQKDTPSRRDGMHLAKEESLLWEGTNLISYAAHSMKLCVPCTAPTAWQVLIQVFVLGLQSKLC